MSRVNDYLCREQHDAFAKELDALRARVLADLGPADAEYIRKLIRKQRSLEVAGRLMLMVGFLPPAWLGGVASLALSKMLDNMEIGHNVLHGQYDWMRNESLDSHRFESVYKHPG